MVSISELTIARASSPAFFNVDNKLVLWSVWWYDDTLPQRLIRTQIRIGQPTFLNGNLQLYFSLEKFLFVFLLCLTKHLVEFLIYLPGKTGGVHCHTFTWLHSSDAYRVDDLTQLPSLDSMPAEVLSGGEHGTRTERFIMERTWSLRINVKTWGVNSIKYYLCLQE